MINLVRVEPFHKLQKTTKVKSALIQVGDVHALAVSCAAHWPGMYAIIATTTTKPTLLGLLLQSQKYKKLIRY